MLAGEKMPYEEKEVEELEHPKEEKKLAEQFLESLTQIREEISQFQKKAKKIHKFLDKLIEENGWTEGSVASIYTNYLNECNALLTFVAVSLDTSIFQLKKRVDMEFPYENMENNARVPIHNFLESYKDYLPSKIKEAERFYGDGCLESELKQLKKFVNQYNDFFNTLLSKLTQLKELKVSVGIYD